MIASRRQVTMCIPQFAAICHHSLSSFIACLFRVVVLFVLGIALRLWSVLGFVLCDCSPFELLFWPGAPGQLVHIHCRSISAVFGSVLA